MSSSRTSSRKSKKKGKTPKWYCQVDGASQKYDEESARRLERAYQKGKSKTVRLKHGFFASQRGVYTVIFQRTYDRTMTAMQANGRTGFQRPVFRKPRMKRVKKKKKRRHSGDSSADGSSAEDSSSSSVMSSSESEDESSAESSSSLCFDSSSSESSSGSTRRRRHAKSKKKNARRRKPATTTSTTSSSTSKSTATSSAVSSAVTSKSSAADGGSSEKTEMERFYEMPEDVDSYKWLCAVDGSEMELSTSDKLRVEEAYRSPKKPKKVRLKHGWFKRQSTKYYAVFERSKKMAAPTRVLQVNSATGFGRKMRRDPSTDECEADLRADSERLETLTDVKPHLRLLTAKDFELLATEDLTCCVCFDEFNPETDLFKFGGIDDSANLYGKKGSTSAISHELADDSTSAIISSAAVTKGVTTDTPMVSAASSAMAKTVDSEVDSKMSTTDTGTVVAADGGDRVKGDDYDYGDWDVSKVSTTETGAVVADVTMVTATVAHKLVAADGDSVIDAVKAKDSGDDDGDGDDDSDDSESEEKKKERAPGVSMTELMAERRKASEVKSSLLEDSHSVCLGECPLHVFHVGCIYTWLRKRMQCPVCKKAYGIVKGDQPKGELLVHKIDESCAGFEDCGSLLLVFRFPGGIQGPEHPHPGAAYYGDERHAFLPNNQHGKLALKLIRKAFKRKLIFTIGFSLTRGTEDVIIWNGIHMKTGLSGGRDSHAWPDETYFERLKEELRAKGIDA